MAFFDGLGKKISQAGQGAFQKTKDIADIAKLNSMISEEEKRANNCFNQIGRMYVQLHSEDFENEFLGFFEDLRDSQAKTEEYRSRMLILRGVTNCPGCGAEVAVNAAFCNSCGNPMPPVQVPHTENTVRCPKCGNTVNREMRFCTRCGNPMTESAENAGSGDTADAPCEAAPAEAAAPEASGALVTGCCPNCGSPTDSGMMFCVECGTKL